MKLIHNCPNCGGTLQDDGRCRFCGSKVYDLTDISLKEPKYIRMRIGNNIIIGRVRFDDFTITTGVEEVPHGELSFRFLADQNETFYSIQDKDGEEE